MGQPVDISKIEGIVQRASRRLRWQAAFEGATTASVAACAAALLVVLLVRREVIGGGVGAALLLATPLVALAGGLLAALRREPEEQVARRVDRVSGLSDRLSTALAFRRMLGRGELATGVEPVAGDSDAALTEDLMRAAIADGVAAAPRADVLAATRFRRPRDARVALGFAAVCALLAGFALPASGPQPRLLAAAPDHAAPGAEVVLRGEHLLAGAAAPAPAATLPPGASVFLGEAATARPVLIRSWSDQAITIVVPAESPLGDTVLTVYRGARALGALPFVVVDAKDQRFHKEDAVAIEDQELEYLKALLGDIRLTAKEDNAEALEDYVAKVEKLLEQAQRGELTKEQLLREMEQAKADLDKGAEPEQDEVAEQLAATGKELAKDPLTRDLGKAMQQGDLEQAQKELQKLADKLDKQELSPREQQQLAEKLDQVAKQFEERQQQQADKQLLLREQLEEQIRRLQKEQQDAKDDRERQDAERRLAKKKDELDKLDKDQRERDESAQREAVKRLHKELDKAAEQLQRRQDRDQQQQQQQASRNLKDAARETGRVQEEQRKQATEKKVASQMEDLKEAMRRAKQKGNKGPQNPFGKDRKQSDFSARARGQKGSRTAWKPSQGQGQGQGQGQRQPGQGQGQGQPGQPGQDPGGSSWGTEHDDNLTGDPTEKGGHTKDEELQGIQGKGPSRRQTILAAAQKGFATAKYQQVYTDYKRIVEEVMRSEKVPSSYKYYVKRYFNQIKPNN
jgi:hypothetical protein